MDGVRVGGLWTGKGDSIGGPFDPAKIREFEEQFPGERMRLLIFPNSYKNKERDPDYKAFLVPDRKPSEKPTELPPQAQPKPYDGSLDPMPGDPLPF